MNDILPNPFRTYGVQNIEKRYSSGGGSTNHQTGISSARGNPEAVIGNQEKAKGIGSPDHEENYQPQKPDVSASPTYCVSLGARWESFYFHYLGRRFCFMVTNLKFLSGAIRSCCMC